MANNPALDSNNDLIFKGRKKILMDDIPITEENIREIVLTTYEAHVKNAADITYLYDYYKGIQPIRKRVKLTRPEINNRVVANIAQEIVDFKVNYIDSDGVQYASINSDKLDDVQLLNRYMGIRDKDTLDKELFSWVFIGGVGVKIVTPEQYLGYGERAPFEMYTVDPRTAYVVYRNKLGEPPALGVKFVTLSDGTKIFSCYTEDHYYEFAVPVGDGYAEILKSEPRYNRIIPIVEYTANMARMGVFESVLDLLDLYNLILSNRGDAIEQLVQSLLILRNIQLTDAQKQLLTQMGMIEYGDRSSDMPGEIKYLSSDLDQNSAQTLQDMIYDTILRIVGMPNDRTHSTSSSDTGSAVILRSGWYEAEGRAAEAEKLFVKSERIILEYVLNLCRETRSGFDPIDLTVSDISIDIPRRPYENPQSKAQVLNTLLATIPPRQAYLYSNISVDIETDLKEYNEWVAEKEAKAGAYESEIVNEISEVNNETVLT